MVRCIFERKRHWTKTQAILLVHAGSDLLEHLLKSVGMKLCFDATRFGGGLSEAIELAAEKGLPAIEYTFAPFKTSGKAGKVQGKERQYLERLTALSKEKQVEIACLSLDFAHTPSDSRSFKQFLAMLTKLSEVCAMLDCKRLGFWLYPGLPAAENARASARLESGSTTDEKSGDGSAAKNPRASSSGADWKEKFEAEYSQLLPVFSERGVKPLIHLGTHSSLRGVSLKNWRAMEPQDWRDLLSICPELGLSFSPGDCLWLGIDYLQILPALTSAIEHVEAHDVEINRTLLKDSGLFGPLWWRYRQIGKGQVDWGQLIEALKLYDYKGEFSIQLDDEFLNGDELALLMALDDSIQKIKPLLN